MQATSALAASLSSSLNQVIQQANATAQAAAMTHTPAGLTNSKGGVAWLDPAQLGANPSSPPGGAQSGAGQVDGAEGRCITASAVAHIARYDWLYNNTYLSDIDIKIGTGVFNRNDPHLEAHSPVVHCHRCVLATLSTTYRAMFEDGNWQESNVKSVTMDYTRSTCLCVLRHIYCCEECLTLDNALEVLDAAVLYNLSVLRDATIKFLKANISNDTVFDYLNAALMFQESSLKEHCVAFVRRTNAMSDALYSDVLYSIPKDVLLIVVEEAVIDSDINILTQLHKWCVANSATQVCGQVFLDGSIYEPYRAALPGPLEDVTQGDGTPGSGDGARPAGRPHDPSAGERDSKQGLAVTTPALSSATPMSAISSSAPQGSSCCESVSVVHSTPEDPDLIIQEHAQVYEDPGDSDEADDGCVKKPAEVADEKPSGVEQAQDAGVAGQRRHVQMPYTPQMLSPCPTETASSLEEGAAQVVPQLSSCARVPSEANVILRDFLHLIDFTSMSADDLCRIEELGIVPVGVLYQSFKKRVLGMDEGRYTIRRGAIHLRWDDTHCKDVASVEGENHITKHATDGWEAVVALNRFSEGKHYWVYTIHDLKVQPDSLIGISHTRTPPQQDPRATPDKDIVCYDVGSNQVYAENAEVTKHCEKDEWVSPQHRTDIGVQLDFYRGCISFYHHESKTLLYTVHLKPLPVPLYPYAAIFSHTNGGVSLSETTTFLHDRQQGFKGLCDSCGGSKSPTVRSPAKGARVGHAG